VLQHVCACGEGRIVVDRYGITSSSNVFVFLSSAE